MSYAVRRVLVGVFLLAVLAACGGPGTAKSAATTSTTPSRPVPQPAGAGCAEAGDLAQLADKNFVDALKAIPSAATFASYATLDSTRVKKLNAVRGVTAFVPLDSAWTHLDATQAQQLADPMWQGAAVEYALVPELVLPEDFAAGKTGAMPTYRSASATLSGVQAGEGVVLNGVANVVCTSIAFDGGLIYLTDRVLVPNA